MREALIVGAARSPIGKKNGKLSGFHPTDLLGTVLKGLLERTGVDPLQVDDVVGGCVTQAGEQGVNVTRNAWIAAGLPWEVPATSVDRQCGSSQQAVHFAAAGVLGSNPDSRSASRGSMSWGASRTSTRSSRRRRRSRAAGISAAKRWIASPCN